MADPKMIPPEPHRPEIPGGRYRPSLRVETQYHPAIERRRELNARLLARTCPYGEDAVAFTAQDLPLLRTVVEERHAGEHALLRHQAVAALGRLVSLEAAETLTLLARDRGEHDAIRAAALTGIRRLAPALAGALGQALRSDNSPLLARALESAPAQPRRNSGAVPAEDARSRRNGTNRHTP